MSNPVLSDRYFTPAAGTQPAPLAPPGMPGTLAPARTGTMTMGGTASAAGLMLVFMIAGGVFGWSKVHAVGFESGGRTIDATTFPGGWLLGSVVVGFVLVIACCFRPPLARILALPYAIAEGVALGLVSHTYDIRTQGVALEAIIATVGVFAVMLALYGLRILRVTQRMTKAIIAATFGVMAVYLVGWIASFFNNSGLRFMDSTSGLSIGVSLLVVGIAAFNLLLDFDFIERGVKAGLPKEMEWFGALGLVITLVWLYLELLRLLSKLQRR